MAEAMKATLPLSRVLAAATHLGSQDVAACPPDSLACWMDRGLDPYFEGDPVDHECANCWATYLLTGR